MSFEIHGFAPQRTSDPTAGLLILRFSEPASGDRIDALANELRSAGVLEEERQPIGAGSLAALPWRVPSAAEIDEQRDALAKVAGVTQAWAFCQSAETDLSDWFAPKWRSAPPSSPTAFSGAPRPERVSWEGFGVSMSFTRPLDDGDRAIIRALAELWLSAYSDRGAGGRLGSKCYRRAVIAPGGENAVIVGLEGLANPGTDDDVTGHLLWLAEQVASVLPLDDISFLSLLPQAGESGETIAPAKVLERATREWKGELVEEMTQAGLAEAAPPTLTPEAAAAATDEIETVTDSSISDAEIEDEFDDDAWAVETKHLPRADELIANAVAASNGVSTQVEVKQAPPADDETLEVAAHDLAAIDGTLEGAPTLTDDGGDGDASVERLTAALKEGDLAGALAAFDAGSDKAASVEILLDVIEDLDATDWDDLQPIVDLGQRIVAQGPERSSGHLQLINALCRLGRGDEAITLGLAHLDRPGVLFETFERLCVFRRHQETQPLLAALGEHGHDGVGNHYYNLGCKLHPSQPEIAIALYYGAIACGSPRPQADINLGLALLSVQRLDEAVTVTESALETCGDEPNLWANLIDVQTRLDSPKLDDSLTRARVVLAQCGDEHEAESPASCRQGCGALISDIVDALLIKGRAAEAVTLIADSSGEEPMVMRVTTGRARALAITGDIEGARALLDGLSTEDATATAYYRARANVMFLAGSSDAAVGLACAAAMTDANALALMRRDPIADAIADLAIGENGEPPRAPSVPSDATWVAGDREWEIGGLDEDGAKHGPYRYYRADGTLCNECTLEHGKPHGEFVRYHESGDVSQSGSFEDGQLHGTRVWTASPVTTSEQMHNEQISTLIRRSEMDYVKGRVVAVRHYNEEGTLCAPNGEPYPDRPGDVTADAFFRAEDSEWVAGEVDTDGQRKGTWRRWDEQGVLLEESEFAAGDRHGSFKAYFSDGTLSAEGQYARGEKSGTFVYQRRGEAEHDDFPVAAAVIQVAEESHETQIPGVRLYDKSGREVTIDGTPLEEWTSVYPPLSAWFNEMWQVPWPELDDASGNAHRVPHLLLGLLSEDDDIASYVYRALYWHLYNEGTVYAGTAAAIPFLLRLAETPGTPHGARLCNFIRHAACYPADTLTEAAEAGAHAVISTNEALAKRIDVMVKLLGSDDATLRAAAGAVLWGAPKRADEMSSHLSGALATEESEMVRASHMFSLARIGSPESLFVVEAQLDGGSPLVGANAAMAMVMARGSEAGPRVSDRLVAALVDYKEQQGEAYSDSPWSDDHLVTELTQALHFSCDGNEALGKLVAAFDRIKTPDGLAAVNASMMIASADGEPEEVNGLLRAIADCPSLWAIEEGGPLSELLEGYELPTTPPELHELADQ